MPLSSQPDITPISLYNPSKEDFSITWDGEKTKPLRAGEIETYPKWLADHIAKHLCHKLVMERGVKVNYQDDYEEVMKQIQTGL